MSLPAPTEAESLRSFGVMPVNAPSACKRTEKQRRDAFHQRLSPRDFIALFMSYYSLLKTSPS